MNERAKELAKRAGYDGLIYEMCKEGLNTFAEIIVNECINEIAHKGIELLDIDFCHHYQERLRKHFGVEE